MKLSPIVGTDPRPFDNRSGVLPDPQWEMADRLAKAIQARMAPSGGLGLPALLEARRVRYGIPNEAFDAEPVYDRWLGWQIEPKHEEGRKTFGDTSIIMPESQQKRARKESTRVVILSAGLECMDVFASHGIALGQVVNIIRMSPWHHVIGNYGGHDVDVMILRSGDIVSNEDQRRLLVEHKVKKDLREFVREAPDGTKSVSRQFAFTDEDGKTWDPVHVTLDESY